MRILLFLFKKTYRTFVFLLFFYVFVFKCYSQEGPDYNISPLNVIPNTPDVAAWIRNLHTEVSLSTGTVNYRIPIYNFLNSKLNLPIEIGYNSNGIKVAQMSSILGLGWNINVGGFISRQIEGLTDEMTGYFDPPAGDDYGSTAWQNYIEGMSKGQGDNMPDRYTYSVEGISGTFVIENLIIRKLEDNNLKIVGGPIDGFVITGPTGTKYFYELIEETKSINSCSPTNKSFNPNSYLVTKISDVNGREITFQYSPITYTFRSNVVQTVSKQISQDPVLANTGIAPSRYPLSSCLTSNTVNGHVLTGINSTEGENIIFSYVDRQDVTGSKQLVEIQVKNNNDLIKKVQFYSSYVNTSSNFASSYTPAGDKRMFLDSLDIIDVENLSPQRYRFTYERKNQTAATLSFAQDRQGYFNGINNGTLIPKPDSEPNASPPVWGVSSFANRKAQFYYGVIGQLKKVQFPSGGTDSIVYEPHYAFSAKSDACTPIELVQVSGESEFKQAMIYQGTLTISNNLTNPKVHYACTPIGDIDYENQYYSTSVQVIDVNNVVKFSGSASKGEVKEDLLSLAPGAYTIKVTVRGACWGNADFSGCQSQPPTSEGFKNEIGGVRVKEIYHMDKGTIQESKSYEYGINGGASVTANPNPFFETIFTRYFSYNAGTWQQYWPADYKELTSFSFFDYPQYSGSYISYSRVKENYLKDGEMGAIEHKYNVLLDVNGQVVLGNLIPNSALSNFGLHTGREYYTATYDAQSKLLEEKNFYYRDVASHTIAKVHYIFSNRSAAVVKTASGQILNVDVNKYTLFSKWNVLDSVVIKKYHENVLLPSVEIQSYDYLNSAHKLTSRVSRKSSSNEIFQTYFLYPQDYLPGNASLDALVSNGVIAAPVEIVYGKLNMNNVVQVLAGRYNSYFTNGKGQIDRNFSFETQSAVPLSSFKFSNVNIGLLPFSGTKNLPAKDGAYNTAQIFNNYDLKGNPREFQESEKRASSVYLWGYNCQYPLLEIKNANYAEVAAVLTQAVIDNLNGNSHTEAMMETLITNAANKLRTALPQAMVTSYTYKPLVGMTSKTDTRGITEYYKYDGMQRLQAILDHLNYVNKSFDYHYRPN